MAQLDLKSEGCVTEEVGEVFCLIFLRLKKLVLLTECHPPLPELS